MIRNFLGYVLLCFILLIPDYSQAYHESSDTIRLKALSEGYNLDVLIL